MQSSTSFRDQWQLFFEISYFFTVGLEFFLTKDFHNFLGILLLEKDPKRPSTFVDKFTVYRTTQLYTRTHAQETSKFQEVFDNSADVEIVFFSVKIAI